MRSTTGIRPAAIGSGQFRLDETGSLCFARITDRILPAVEWFGRVCVDLRVGREGAEVFRVRRIGIDVECLLANGSPHAPTQQMAIIVGNAFPGAPVDDGLLMILARPLFSFEGANRDTAKLDALDRGPWFDLSLDDFNSVKACLLELNEELGLLMRSADAATPQGRIVL